MKFLLLTAAAVTAIIVLLGFFREEQDWDNYLFFLEEMKREGSDKGEKRQG